MLTVDTEAWEAAAGDAKSDIVRHEARLHDLEAGVARLQARLDALQTLERHRNAVLARYPLVEHAGLAVAVTIPASGFIDAGDGFYSLEHGTDGRPFRWTGPHTEPRVTVWVDRSRPVQVAVSFATLGRSAADAALEIKVDGTPYPLRPAGSGLQRLAGPIPPRPGAGPTEIVLLTPILFSPQQDGLPDTRTLGFAVYEIAVTQTVLRLFHGAAVAGPDGMPSAADCGGLVASVLRLADVLSNWPEPWAEVLEHRRLASRGGDAGWLAIRAEIARAGGIAA